MISMTSKKGFFSIFWIAIIMIVTTAMMITATNMFSDFVPLPNSLLTTPFQGYYNAEFGMWYGKAALDSGVTTTPGAPLNYAIPADAVNRNTVPLRVTIERIGNTTNYTITSTENRPAENRPPSTMRARWDGTRRVLYQID